MEAICIKLDKNMLKTIDESITRFNYCTRTDFVREAIRDKLRKLEVLKKLYALRGTAKNSVTDEELEAIRDKVSLKYLD
jgi:metal-responsive CopG/Arc/MetJ family transcriptional regulator